MEPISSVLAIAHLVEEVISIAQKISSSLSKVSRNWKGVQELLAHINSTLEELRCLCNDEEEASETCTDLRKSLDFVKTEMSRVLQLCQNLAPDSNSGRHLSQVKVKAMVWYKREDIEADLLRLRELVMLCYSKFTAFSAARIEHTSIRTENALLVHGTETRVHLSRIETLVYRMLLDTHYGHMAVGDLNARLAGAQYDSVEQQYLALQLNRIVESLGSLAAVRTFRAEEPNEAHKLPLKPVYPARIEITDTTYLSLRLLQQIQNYPDDLSIQDGIQALETISIAVGSFGMQQQALAFNIWITNLYKTLVSGNSYAFLPHLGHSFTNLALAHGNLEEYDLAFIASEKAVSCFRSMRDSHAGLDLRAVYAQALLTHGRILCQLKRLDEALSIIQEGTSIYETLLAELPQTFSDNPLMDAEANAKALQEHSSILMDGLSSILYHARCLSSLDRPSEAYHVAKKSLSIFPRLPKSEHHIAAALHDHAFELMFVCLSSIYARHSLPLSLVEDILSSYHDLAQAQPTFFSRYFLQALYVYACVCNSTDSNDIAQQGSSSDGNPFVQYFPDISERLKRLGHFEWAKSITRDAVYALHIQDTSYFVRSYNSFGIQDLVETLLLSQVNQGLDGIREASEKIISGEVDDIGVIDNFMLKIRDHVQVVKSINDKSKLLVISDDVMEHYHSKISSTHANGRPGLARVPSIFKAYSEILDCYPHRKEDALKCFEELLQLYRQQEKQGLLSPSNLAHALQKLAYRYETSVNRLEDAITTLREAIAVWRREEPPDRLALASALSTLSDYLSRAGRRAEAEVARAESRVCRDMSQSTLPLPVTSPVTEARGVIEEGIAPVDQGPSVTLCSSSEEASLRSPVSSFTTQIAFTSQVLLRSSPDVTQSEAFEDTLGSPQYANLLLKTSPATSSRDFGNEWLAFSSPAISSRDFGNEWLMTSPPATSSRDFGNEWLVTSSPATSSRDLGNKWLVTSSPATSSRDLGNKWLVTSSPATSSRDFRNEWFVTSSPATSSRDLGKEWVVTSSSQFAMTTATGTNLNIPFEGGGAGLALLRRQLYLAMHCFMIFCTVIFFVNLLCNHRAIDIHFAR